MKEKRDGFGEFGLLGLSNLQHPIDWNFVNGNPPSPSLLLVVLFCFFTLMNIFFKKKNQIVSCPEMNGPNTRSQLNKYITVTDAWFNGYKMLSMRSPCGLHLFIYMRQQNTAVECMKSRSAACWKSSFRFRYFSRALNVSARELTHLCSKLDFGYSCSFSNLVAK